MTQKKKKLDRLMIENAVIAFKNFSGKEGKYNRAGDRNFVVILDDELVPQLISDGWNVKFLKPREEGDKPQAYLPVAVNYNGPRPPKVVLINSRGRSDISEEEISILDWAEMAYVDLVINPYEWEMVTADGPKSGVKAYLQAMYVTLEENPFEDKYADIPDSAQNVTLTQEDPF